MAGTANDDPSITEETVVARNANLLTSVVHDETVMMDLDSGHYYGLDDIGSEIWRHLEAPCRFGELVDRLAAEYDADRGIIAEDVRKLLSVMAEHKAVTVAQGS